MEKIKTLLLTVCLIIPLISPGQTHRLEYDAVAGNLIKYYNQNQPDSIFEMYSPEMKAALPINKNRDFFSGLMIHLGKIARYTLEEETDIFVLYKCYFSIALLDMQISVGQNTKITGLYFKPHIDPNFKEIERNSTELILPFNGEWFVFWGGDTEEQNYHVTVKSQKNAFDFLITDQTGKSFRTDGKTNEDYYCFGEEIFAPCDGEILFAVDGIEENKPGVMSQATLGNSILMKIAENEYIFMSHFKQNSLKVLPGDKVKKGQLLGLCGNSGRSSEPHLHFHIQNSEDINAAIGVKCFFEEIDVNGEMKKDYSPVREEKVKNIVEFK